MGGASIQRAMWEMIEAGGRTAQTFGVNRMFGQIYMLLYLKADPLSLDEIAGHLGVSKASVSIACRQLETFGAVLRVWKKGDRKDYYEAEQDVRRLLREGLLGSVEKKLESARVQIQRCESLLEGSDDPEAKRMRERLQEAEARRNKISSLLTHPLVKQVL